MANSFLDEVSSINTSEPVAKDPSNAMINSSYLGNVNPQKTLESPDASFAEKVMATDTLLSTQQRQQTLDEEAAKAKVADDAKRFNAWQNANKKYDQMEQMATMSGGKFKLPSRDEALAPEKFGLDTAKIAKFSDPETQQAAAPVVKEQEQKNAAAQEQSAIEQANVLGQKQAIKEKSMLDGYMSRQAKIDQRQQELMDQSIKAVDDKQYELDKIDPNKFWNSFSGGQQILGSLAIALGEVGKSLTGSGSNAALDMINKSIDRNIEGQKLNNEQKIQMKQNALKRIALEVEKFSALSKNNERQFEMNKYAESLRQQSDALKQQSVQQEMLKKQLFGGGISPDQVDMLSDQQKLRTLVLPNGNITVAASKDMAEKAQSILNENKGALDAVKNFKDSVSKLGVVDKLNPFSADKASVVTNLQALVGKLRVPITGPGVLNEQEYQRISKDVLGDPTSLMQTPALFQARISALEKLLKTSQKATYEQAGVRYSEPMTKSDLMRKRLYQSGSYKPEEVENAIEALAKKDPSYRE